MNKMSDQSKKFTKGTPVDTWREFIINKILNRSIPQNFAFFGNNLADLLVNDTPLTIQSGLSGDGKPETRMDLWDRSRRFVTYDGTNNYEGIENYGDKVIGKAFDKFLHRKAPGRPPLHYTEWIAHYLSNSYLARISDELGLHEHLQYKYLKVITDPIKADMFESICGAMTEVADDLLDGLGDIIVYNFIVSFFGSIELDEKRAQGSGKTVFEQILRQMDIKVESYKFDSLEIVNETHHVTVNMPQEVVKNIRNFGYRDFPFPRNPIGRGVNDSLKIANIEAYTQALDFLINKGIKRDEVSATKSDRDFTRAVKGEIDLLEKANEIAGDAGYESIGFEMPSKAKTNQYTVAILYGINEGRKTNLVVRLYKNKTDADERKQDPDRFRRSLLRIYTGGVDHEAIEEYNDEEETEVRPSKASRTIKGLRTREEKKEDTGTAEEKTQLRKLVIPKGKSPAKKIQPRKPAIPRGKKEDTEKIGGKSPAKKPVASGKMEKKSPE